MNLNIIILAAGQGKRMSSMTPKVLHALGGLTLLERVVQTAQKLSPFISVVHGNDADSIQTALKDYPIHWVHQPQALGTGHAVLQALPTCSPENRILILYGDVPFISVRTLENLLQQTPQEQLGLVVARSKDPQGLGRILRDEHHNIVGIIEHKEANPKELTITEVNTGIMTAPAAYLKKWLPKIHNNNRQGEYYLTDIIALATADKIPIVSVQAQHEIEILGVNDRWELLQLERQYQQERIKQLVLSGVSIANPVRFELRCEAITVGKNVYFDVDVLLEGNITIGDQCHIGPHVILKNVTIGNNVRILPFTVIENATIEDGCQIGPLARLRAHCHLGPRVKIGNFVELKNTKMDSDSKANHLSYLGDASIGESANIGAGTITCNYDGENKWPTKVGSNAFIGSHTALVAPLEIGEGATIGAGSVITKNAPPQTLTLSRVPQETVVGWKRRKKEKPL